MSHQFNHEFELEMFEYAHRIMNNIRLEKSDLFLQTSLRDDVLTNTSIIPRRKRNRNKKKNESSSQRNSSSSMIIELPVE